MNKLEKEMLNIIKELKNEYGVVSVKAEFEAEGTRVDELLRLLELTYKADLKVALKIGGCEAVRDLLESKSFGCDYIIAPMVESAYGLSKFIEAKNKVFTKPEEGPECLFNVETITCFNNRIEVFDLAYQNLEGAVFGRVDYTGSKGLGRDLINEQEVTDDVMSISQLTKDKNLDYVVGGGVSIDAIPALKQIKTINLTRFETRKIVFSGEALDVPKISTGLLKAVQFELCWLKNKRGFYETIFNEDNNRIEMLESRWQKLLNEHKS